MSDIFKKYRILLENIENSESSNDLYESFLKSKSFEKLFDFLDDNLENFKNRTYPKGEILTVKENVDDFFKTLMDKFSFKKMGDNIILGKFNLTRYEEMGINYQPVKVKHKLRVYLKKLDDNRVFFILNFED